MLLGAGLLYCSWGFMRSQTALNARKVLGASVIYLPLLLLLIVIDVIF